jgi:outer membrane immunogenic protein
MIRRILLASAGAMALAGPAFAADLAPPPVYVPPPPMWTGFYVGVNAGYDWAASTGINTNTVNVLSFGTLNGAIGSEVAALATGAGSLKPAGFIGGGQIGYNYQFANSWVAGIEADIDGIAGAHSHAALAQAGSVPGSAPLTSADGALLWTKSVDYLGTVRGRFGFLVIPTLLVYGTGGLAYGETNASTGVAETLGYPDIPGPFGAFGSTTTTRVGWTAGGGLEWMFWPNWSFKVEYLYYDLGNVSYGFPVVQTTQLGSGPFPPGGVETIGASRTTTRFNGSVVRAGINYHFNWGAPAAVVAKY